MHYNTAFVRKIKAAASIVQEAIEFFDLAENGENFTTTCDKCGGKMGINTKVNIHKCFGENCDNHGDVLSFVQKYRRMSFPEAVVYLAKKYGVEMPPEYKKSKTDFGRIEMKRINEDSFIPNSFQMPNAYIDQLCFLLTPEEFAILVYIVRRIFGFGNKRALHQDNISISQIQEGQKRNGKIIGHGVGISRPTIMKCLKNLCKFRIIRKVGAAKKIGQLIELNLDGDEFDWKALKKRQSLRQKLEIKRAKSIQDATGKSHLPVSGKSHLPNRPNDW